ncbi:phage baseplate assembly protein V [Zymomonas mobilis]|uniref:phage baseplate assembly protein V n=1 Tax=Zymomonas mobilis TaxID=542 RepID=UPI0039EAA943
MKNVNRKLSSLILYGTVEKIEDDTAQVRISDNVLSPPLPWAALAGNLKTWAAPSIGEQVAILCPDGDINTGYITARLYSDKNASPSIDPNEYIIAFPDGTLLKYNADKHILTGECHGETQFKFPQGLTIEGNISIKGDIKTSGKIEATDVTASGISLKTHKHPVSGSSTGTPV